MDRKIGGISLSVPGGQSLFFARDESREKERVSCDEGNRPDTACHRGKGDGEKHVAQVERIAHESIRSVGDQSRGLYRTSTTISGCR
ncbi:MAG TPA: hypothetical protein VE398_16570 [Acidobacteriota bacterium]|nr:hypothetical protein [Acidobacteriota bacterium]